MSKTKNNEASPSDGAQANAKLSEAEYKAFIQKQIATASATNTGTGRTVLATTQVSLQVPAPAQAQTSTQIWNEIKDLPLSMFALPPKPVHTYCTVYDAGGSTLYLDSKTPAFLAALETLITNKYDVQRGQRFIEISLKPLPPPK